MIKWTVGGKPRMALFAGDQGIMTGEELTYDYNFDPYSIKNVQQCRCGSANCRGVLGPRPREIKDALKPITSAAGGKKRKLKEAMEGAVEAVVGGTRKRKIAVPKSVKNVIAKAKDDIAESWEVAKSAVGSSANKEQLVKKESQKPLRGWKGWVLVDDEGKPMSKEDTEKVIEEAEPGPRKRRRTAAPAKVDKVEEVEASPRKRKRTTTTTTATVKSEKATPGTNRKSVVAHEKRRSSNGTFLKKTDKDEEKDTEAMEDGEETVDEDWSRPISRKDSIKAKGKSVVRTIRRGSKSGMGKSIRVIGDEDEDEE